MNMEEAEEKRRLIPEDETAAGGDHVPGFTWRRLCVIPVVIVHFYALGITLYAIPEFIQSRAKGIVVEEHHKDSPSSGGEEKFNPCNANKSSPEYKIHTEIQQESAKWLIYLALSSYIPAFVSNLVLGTYSDILGRKIVFGLCTVGNTLRCAVITAVIYFEANLLFVLLGTIIDGITGSFTVFFTVLFSYVSDITEPGKARTVAIVLFELLLGLTISVSSLATGYFIKAEGFLYPMFTATVVSAVASVLSLTIIPETLSSRHRSENKSCIANVVRSAKFYFSSESRVKRCKYLLLILCFAFVAIPNLNRMTLETLYQLGRPFCWDPTKIGLFGTIKIVLMCFLGIGAVLVLHKCFNDDSIALIGCISGIASFIVEGLATTDAVLYTVPVIASVSLLPIPMLRSTMSSFTSAADQGALFASIGAVETICTLLGALTNNTVYAATISIMNGFVFLVCAGANFVGLLFLVAYMCVARNQPELVIMEEVVPQPPD